MPRNRILSIGGGSVFASGGVTNNVIPKSNGASQLADSALSDNGTNVISTEAILAPAGTSSLPSYSFSAASGIGMYEVNGNVINLKATSSSWFTVDGGNNVIQMPSQHTLGWASGTTINGVGSDLILRRRTTANLAFGATDVNGVPVDQTISVQNAITGTNLVGGHFTIDAPLGTGNGAASKISINRALMAASGATAQTSANAWAVGQSKTLSNTSATAQTIATITLGSNAGGGCAGTFTIVSSDGTNFDAETQSFNVSFVNKATVVTVGSVVVTATTAAANSGTTSLGITAVANGNNVDIKVTPVFGTIVPTTVTLYPVITHSTNTVTFA